MFSLVKIMIICVRISTAALKISILEPTTFIYHLPQRATHPPRQHRPVFCISSALLIFSQVGQLGNHSSVENTGLTIHSLNLQNHHHHHKDF